MNWNEYLERFEEVLNGTVTSGPYDDPSFVNYVKLNRSRQNRWFKTMQFSEEAKDAITSVTETQHWILIGEPWCGDSANIAPFIAELAKLNPKINFEMHLRDEAPYLIDQYLTNGGKSIPKLIVRDGNNNDLFTWGPRPEAGRLHMEELKKQDFTAEERKAEMQKWYNEDKGESFLAEFAQLLRESVEKVTA